MEMWQDTTQRREAGGSTVYTVLPDHLNFVSHESRVFNEASGHFSRLLRLPVDAVQCVEVIEWHPQAPVMVAYEDCRLEFASRGLVEEIYVFHGTGRESMEGIILNGFLVGGDGGVPIRNGAASGPGIYTAISPNTPMFYSSRSGENCIILATALVGKKEIGRSVSGTDYNTIAPNGGDIRIFREGRQLLPKFIITYNCSLPNGPMHVSRRLFGRYSSSASMPPVLYGRPWDPNYGPPAREWMQAMPPPSAFQAPPFLYAPPAPLSRSLTPPRGHFTGSPAAFYDDHQDPALALAAAESERQARIQEQNELAEALTESLKDAPASTGGDLSRANELGFSYFDDQATMARALQESIDTFSRESSLRENEDESTSTAGK